MASWSRSNSHPSTTSCPQSESAPLSEVDEDPQVQSLAEEEGVPVRAVIRGLRDDGAGLVRDKEDKIFAIRSLQTQPHINVFPFEILSAIFQLVCIYIRLPTVKGFHESQWHSSIYADPAGGLSIASALTVSAVSSYWRQVAIFTPKLWQSLIINAMRYRPKSLANLLRLCADRSMALGINIGFDMLEANMPKVLLDLSPYSELANAPLDEFRRTIFVDYAGMIRKLSLLFGPTHTTWLQLALLAPFTCIEELHLDGFVAGGPFNWDMELSKFKEVCEPRLTILDLCSLPYDLCLELMYHCPNLIAYRCLYPSPPKRFATRVDARLNLPFLEWLDIEVMKTRHTFQFMEISVPSARGIRWNDYVRWEGHFDEISSALIQFLSSAKMLTELEFSLEILHVAFLSRVFSMVPGVQRLALSGKPTKWTSDSPLIVALKTTTLTVPLPVLRTLILKAHGYWERENLGIAITEGLFAIIQQRWKLRLVPCFRLDLEFDQTWGDEVRAGLNELVREGLKLEIRMKRKPVEWLL